MIFSYCWPVVKQLGPVLSVRGGAEDVHHHEVLYVVLLSSRLVQLVNIIPGYNLTTISLSHFN